MGSPPAAEYFGDEGTVNDDENPGNLGTGGGAGEFAQPTLALLTQQLARASIRVRVIDAIYDTTDDADFVRNLGDPAAAFATANSKRDMTNDRGFWVAQILASYEGDVSEDDDRTLLDPPEPQATLGMIHYTGDELDYHPSSTIFVVLETIRDVAHDHADVVDSPILRERVVLHEMMHVFHHFHHDVGVMDYDTMALGSDDDNALTGKQLRELMSYDPGMD
jgi:hypothetical protein